MAGPIFVMAHAEARRRAVAAVQNAPVGHVVRISEPTRNLEQSAKLHAIFNDVAKQATWLGQKRTTDQWKVLFISGHAMATKMGSEMIPGLEAEFVNIRESSANMSRSRMSSLIEYCLAWCASNQIQLKETSDVDYV